MHTTVWIISPVCDYMCAHRTCTRWGQMLWMYHRKSFTSSTRWYHSKSTISLLLQISSPVFLFFFHRSDPVSQSDMYVHSNFVSFTSIRFCISFSALMFACCAKNPRKLTYSIYHWELPPCPQYLQCNWFIRSRKHLNLLFYRFSHYGCYLIIHLSVAWCLQYWPLMAISFGSLPFHCMIKWQNRGCLAMPFQLMKF